MNKSVGTKAATRCLLFVLSFLPLQAQVPISGEPAPSLSGLDTAMLELMSTWSSPGAALAVTVDGKLVFAHGYGYADIAANEPVQPDSLFRIASISKPFTAAAILKLIEQGKLQLTTTPFTSILQDLTPPPGQSEDPRINQITIQELLEHSAGWDDTLSGVPDPPFAYVDTAAQALGVDPPATPDILIRFMLGQPLQHDPGTVTAYSNFGYIVLGRIIERVSGQTYAEYVNGNIQTPANILRMQLAGSLLANRATDEVRYYDYPGAPLVGSVFPPLDSPVPAPYGGFSIELMEANGGWIASTMDLLRYVDTMNGQLTPPILQSPPAGFVGYVPPVGDGWGWTFYGSLPGTNTLVHLDTGYQVTGRISWAALFNTRSGTDTSQPDTDADAQLLKLVQGISAWPSNDLFPIYSSAMSSCAFTLSAQTQSVAQGGGAGQISVQDQNYCAWTAVSAVTWVSVTAGNVNADSGTASFTVSANSGPARVGTISIAGQSFTINQAGASPSLTVSPASLDFGSLPIHSTSPVQVISLTNPGQVPVSLNSIVSSGDYGQTNSCGGTLAVGTDCTISVTFTPTAAGLRKGTLTITDDASGSPQEVTLTGTGTAAEQNPTVMVTPSSPTVSTTQSLSVAIAVSGGSGNPSPTGSVILNSGSYTSAAVVLSNGMATIIIPAGSLPTGTDTLTVSYTPDSNSSSTYNSASGANSVTVNPPPSFTLAPTAATLAVVQGSSNTESVTVTGANGFTGNVTLSATGLPNGATAAFATNPTSGTSVLTITASSSATVGGPVTVTISGTSGTLTVSTTIALTVSAAPSFTLSPSVGSLSVVQGASNTDTITVSGANGFNASVTFSVTDLSSGVTASFGTNPATGSSVLTLTASSTATVGGPTTVTITGTSGSLTASTTVALTVNAAPTFVVGGASSSLSIAPGATTGNTVTITVTPSNGFTGTVDLTCSITPVAESDSPTCTLTPSSVTIAGTAAQSSTLTIFTTAATSARNELKKLLWPSASTAMAMLLFGLPRRKRNWLTMLGVFILVVSFGVIGCGGGGGNSGGGGGGGGGNAGTSPGTYAVTVTGTSGTITGTVGTVTLTVQ